MMQPEVAVRHAWLRRWHAVGQKLSHVLTPVEAWPRCLCLPSFFPVFEIAAMLASVMHGDAVVLIKATGALD